MKIQNILRPKTYPAYIAHIRRIIQQIHKDAVISYAQEGEDIIIHRAFKHLKITKPTYLDIGAHHPTRLSNTYLFYTRGFSGVCVEPNPQLAKLFRKKRRRDIMLEVAIGTSTGNVTLHIVSDTSLSTVSDTQAIYFSGTSKHHITKNITVPQMTIMDVVHKYFTHPPSLISIDIEGLDFEVLKTINLNKYRPAVFCIETLTYDEHGGQRKLNEINEYMERYHYFQFADTFINTIFVDLYAWEKIQKIRKGNAK